MLRRLRGLESCESDMPSETPAVDYALSLLDLLSESGEPLTIASISRQMGFNKTMVSRILHTLTQNGWVTRSEEAFAKYQLTLKPFRLFSRVLHRMTVYEVAFPILKALSDTINETTQLYIRRDMTCFLIQNFTCRREVRVASELGVEYPLHRTAPGKVLLAYQAQDFQEQFYAAEIVENSANKTDRSITDRAVLRDEISHIRIQGYGLDEEEYAHGIVCCAVPIFDHTGAIQAAVCAASSTVYGSAVELCSRVLEPLKAAAYETSFTMGWLPEQTVQEK